MTMKPRTIDNLGVDASKRYATDQNILDVELLKGSKTTAARTEVSAVRPYIASEYDTLFQSNRSVSWVNFPMPPSYIGHARRLFSYLLIPSLGSVEKLQADADKLAALADSLSRDPDGERKRKALWDLYQLLLLLNRSLGLINSRRNQYQKG